MAKIVLMGYMGAGKTTIGQLLAERLKIGFKDLDDVIAKAKNMSISEIFETKGELYFRKLESKYLKDEIENQDNFVMSLGGGTPCYGLNLELLQNQNQVITIYLKAQINTIVDRLYNERQTRPLIGHINTKEDLTEFIGKHLFERSSFYMQAHHIISVDEKPIEALVEEILKAINLEPH